MLQAHQILSYNIGSGYGAGDSSIIFSALGVCAKDFLWCKCLSCQKNGVRSITSHVDLDLRVFAKKIPAHPLIANIGAFNCVQEVNPQLG